MLSVDSHIKRPNAYWSCQDLGVHMWTFFSNPYSSTWNFATRLHKFLPQHYLKWIPVPSLLFLQSLHFPSCFIFSSNVFPIDLHTEDSKTKMPPLSTYHQNSFKCLCNRFISKNQILKMQLIKNIQHITAFLKNNPNTYHLE